MWLWLVPLAYLLGTFPSANLVARANGIDIRSVGSGNPGASNVARVLGWRKGVWVFVLDAAKGAVAAGIGMAVSGRPAAYALGIAAILGHMFPIWHRFRGGKGVATGAGVLAVLAPIQCVAVIGLWLIVSRLTHKASIATIVVIAVLPIWVGIDQGEWWEVVATAAVCLLIMARHIPNIRRLLAHDELTLEN